MGKCTLLGVVLVLAGAVPARASLITIDFDDLVGMNFFSGNPVPASAVLTDQYASLGVLFSNTAVVDFGTGHTVTPPNGIGGITAADTLTYSSSGGQQIEFAFFVGLSTAVTDFVSIQGDLGGSGDTNVATLSAFDLYGNLLLSTTIGDPGGQTYSISIPGIHRVKWSGVDIADDEGGGIGLDHLQFNEPLASAALPEPASLWIAASGFGLVTALQKRRRAKAAG